MFFIDKLFTNVVQDLSAAIELPKIIVLSYALDVLPLPKIKV
jgi:hypothetical protein